MVPRRLVVVLVVAPVDRRGALVPVLRLGDALIATGTGMRLAVCFGPATMFLMLIAAVLLVLSPGRRARGERQRHQKAGVWR
jgi:hypothetical protein